MEDLDLSVLTNGKPFLNNREKKIVTEALKNRDDIHQVLIKINQDRILSNKERKNLSSSADSQPKEEPSLKLTNKDKKILRESEVQKILDMKRHEVNYLENKSASINESIEKNLAEAEIRKKEIAEKALKEKEKELRELNEQISLVKAEAKDCVVCMEVLQHMIGIAPCGHVNVCLGCIQKIMSTTKRCPTCRTTINSYNRIFLT